VADFLTLTIEPIVDLPSREVLLILPQQLQNKPPLATQAHAQGLAAINCSLKGANRGSKREVLHGGGSGEVNTGNSAVKLSKNRGTDCQAVTITAARPCAYRVNDWVDPDRCQANLKVRYRVNLAEPAFTQLKPCI
jgi:hypothetical protein